MIPLHMVAKPNPCSVDRVDRSCAMNVDAACRVKYRLKGVGPHFEGVIALTVIRSGHLACIIVFGGFTCCLWVNRLKNADGLAKWPCIGRYKLQWILEMISYATKMSHFIICRDGKKKQCIFYEGRAWQGPSLFAVSVRPCIYILAPHCSPPYVLPVAFKINRSG